MKKVLPSVNKHTAK